MAKKGLSMRGDNVGLTVRVNLWALEKYQEKLNPALARSWVTGMVTNAETNKRRFFHDPGELITILGKWNAEKFKQIRRKTKAKR